jgi:hypothetical protein
VVGWSSRLCSGGLFKKFPPFGHSEQTKFSLLGRWKPSRTPCTTSSQPKSDRLVCSVVYRRHWALLFLRGWSHSYGECHSILRHVGEFSAPGKWEYGEEHNREDFLFQQDGATAHTTRRPCASVKEMFPGRVVSLHEAVPWPPRSPDLSPCDFLMWRTSRPRFPNIVLGPWTN